MPCYFPLRAQIVTSPKGKRSLLFKRQLVRGGKAVSLPCGRCIGCRLERSRQWAVRIMHEAKMHEENSFLTLTYDDAHLPKDGSLSVEHCQLFMKRLRAKIEPVKIRFFLCGEYGEKMSRPHYHAVIFGYGFPDKRQAGKRGEYVVYQSNLCDAVWGLGGARIGTVSFESASYVANYATKKIVGDKEAVNAHYQGLKSEFLLMSRKPGIGASWFGKYGGDVFPSDEVIVRGVPTRPPRFYDGIFAKDHEGDFARIKAKRESEAGRLEEFVSRIGSHHLISPSCNSVRLGDGEKVARAKLALKRRDMESGKC